MKKIKSTYKLKILLGVVVTLLMIGTSFSPIVNSIPINTNNNQNIIEQNKKLTLSKEKSLDIGLDSKHQGIWVNVTKTVNPKNIHPCEPATVFINISAQGKPLPMHIPVAVMLVIDISGSMDWEYKNGTGVNHPALYYIKNAAIAFINQMDLVNDTAGIVTFADQATLKQQLTHNKNTLINAINSLTANGATNTGEGIRVAQQELNSHRPSNAYPVMILMTDGLPTTHHQGNSLQSCENCPISNNTCTDYARLEANLAKAANTSIFSIAFTGGIYGYCQQNNTVHFANWLLLDISSGSDYFYSTADINTLAQIYLKISSKIGQIVINNLHVTDYLPNNIQVLSTGGGTYSVLPNGTKKMIFVKNFLSLNDTWHISFNISTCIIGNNILVNYPNSNLTYIITNTPTNTTYSEYLPYPNYINITNPLIMKKNAPNQVYQGGQFNYTINVTNIGHMILHDLIIIDPLPGDVTFNSVISNYSGFSTNNWNFYTGNHTLIINNVTIQINEKIWFKITVTVKNNAGSSLINTAHGGYITSYGCMINDLVNSTTVTVIQTSNPSIHIDKSADNHLVHIGDTITYTFTVNNTGDVTLTNVTTVDNMLGPITLGTNTLASGHSTSGTATYVVVEGDLPGPIINTATATGTPPTGPIVTDTDIEYVSIQYAPGISINKQANVNSVNIGDTITYTYTVKNTGNIILTGVNVADDMLGSITLGTTTLSPSGTTTGTATYTVKESDLPGPIVNTATATGTPPYGDNVNDTDNQIVTIQYEDAICLNKTADVDTASVGQTITYTYTVTNCGDVTLTGVTVVDDMLGSITLGTTTLSPGGTTTGTATYTVKESDLPGPIVNTATATGTPPYGDDVTDTDSLSVSLTFITCISIDKQANVATATIGETITYTCIVTNCGDVTLTGVTVVDDMLGSITLGTTTLSPGGTTTGTATYTVKESDLPGPIINTATATGTPPLGGTVTDFNSVSVSLTYTACININKQANVATATIGQTITYTYNVTNCGDVTLTGITVVDNKLGSITLGKTTLSPGDTTTGTKTYTVKESDLPGPIVNTATATGTPPIGNTVTDTDSQSVSLTYTACINIEKTANVANATIGQTITYTYTVTNCGDVTLTGVTVVDNKLGSITLGTTTLSPGGTTTGTKTYTVKESDLPGPIVNTATATGTPPIGNTVTDTDSQSVSLTYTACIDINKQANVATATIGQTITYTYTVTNCGDVTLTGVTVVDNKLGSITLGKTILSPGDTTTGTKTYTVLESDLPGPIVNTATATGTPPIGGTVTDSDSESVSLTYTACIDINKQANVATATIGQTITYTYTVTNCGDVTLTGITVVDNKLGSITLGKTTLSPGGTTTGTVTYTVKESDLPGPIVNTATATGTPPIGGTVTDSDSESVSLTYTACIDINKQANVASATLGQTITYTYTVTNCGDVTLTGVTVVDNKLGAITLGTTTLSPGQSTQGTKSIVVVCENYPTLINNAIATGTDPIGKKVTDQDSESVNIIISSSINIEKYVYDDLTGKWTNSLTTFAGFNINFKITVKNDGNYILNNVIVTDYLPTSLVYNDNANPTPNSITGNKIQWNIGVLNINQVVTIYFSAKATTVGNGNNKANASGTFCITFYDQSEIPITVLPCRNEVWIDDNWHGQSDVNLYNPNLLWGINAFNHIQRGIDVLCNCGTVHVRSGTYVEQIIINKDLQMIGENKPLIVLPNIVKSFTIHGSAQSWVPIVLAYGGILIGNDITGTGNIAVKIDGFRFDARNYPGSVAILYHNVESGCVPAIISNNTITKTYIGIKIDGCTDDTTIIHNRITWEKRTSGRIGIIITSSGGCEPNNVKIHYNYLGAQCGLNIGIWNQVSNIVGADLNWWGEDDGPSSPTSGYTYDAITGRIADGLGDKVIGLVHFDPWWGTDASANVHPLNVLVGQLVYFDASTSFAYDENGPINPADIEYMWKFDDGFYSFSKICTHIYNSPGTYNVILRITVYDNYYIEGVSGDLMDFAYFTIHVSQTTALLFANADSKNLKGYEGTINYPIQLYGSSGGGETPYIYKWDLGDGSTSNENNPIHIYKDVKEYNVILTVTDNTAATAQDTAIVTIYKDKLTAYSGGSYIGNIGEKILFKGQAIGGIEPYYYIWDFGYGNITQEQNPTHIFYKEGTYHVTLVVIDSKGNIDEDIVEVQIIKDNRAEIKQVNGGIRITATIVAGDTDCDWTINVQANFMLLGGEASGTIQSNTQQTVKLPLTLAFGKVQITVNANEITKQYTAIALGPIFLNLQAI